MRSRGDALSQALGEAGFRGRRLPGEPLGPLTTWRIGGPAELLAVPEDADDLARAVSWAAATGVPWRILGNGSNLLVADAGVSGLVLRLRRVLDEVRVSEATLEAGAGALLPALANLAASRGLAGIEFAAGIPGTLGGGIRINAGWHRYELGLRVRRVEWLTTDGERRERGGDACGFRYRGSRFRDEGGVILGATLELESDRPEAIDERMRAFAASRKANQPTDQPSCGSVFLKPEGDFAGRLIEAAGLKGRRVGDAEVSKLHANFFVNRGRASSADVLALVELVETEVWQRFGVRLTREFELWSD